MRIAVEKRFSGFHIFLFFIYIISVIGITYLIYQGWDYYTTSFAERPRHQDYQTLKPGGMTGHGFGVIGSVMMLIMLLYSLRKRSNMLSKAGPLSHWLDIHIYLGIFGPMLIILHSTLKIHGLVAVSFYSMLAVALSGVLGRYLYLHIPRNIQGLELTLGELQAMDQKLTRDLQERYQFTDAMISKLEHLTQMPKIESGNTLLFLYHLVKADLKKKRI